MRRRKISIVLALLPILALFGIAACTTVTPAPPAEGGGAAAGSAEPVITYSETEGTMGTNMSLFIDGKQVPVKWETNDSVVALTALLKDGPLVIEMSMYGGFEQVGSIGTSLPRSDARTTTEYGDIVLYSGDKIVVFYGSNTWSYTRLGHVDLSEEELIDLLSVKDVTIKLVRR
ncbi:MAG: hypothetical protein IKG85_03955 [Clostridia bacterium]|nr:hypothetical protein [Clostridia bacterium]